MKPVKRSLSRTQRQYLDLLLNIPDGVPTDTFLECHGWTRSGANLVAQHIVNLRRKVEGQYVIEAIHGFGYQMFAVEPKV